jgi:quinol monooxygenase YgiN
MEINLTVILKTNTDNLATLRSKIIDLVHKSTQEKACLQYELHQSNEDQTLFVLHETWENQEGLELHNNKEYLKDFFESTKLLLDEPIKVYRTDRIA